MMLTERQYLDRHQQGERANRIFLATAGEHVLINGVLRPDGGEEMAFRNGTVTASFVVTAGPAIEMARQGDGAWSRSQLPATRGR